MSEIRMPIINSTPSAIKNGQLVYIKTTRLHIFVWGKFRRYRWYHRFIFKKTVEIGIVESVEHAKPFTYNEELVQWAEQIANKPMSVGELVENAKWLIHNYKK